MCGMIIYHSIFRRKGVCVVRNKVIKMILVLGMLFVLSGCISQSGESMYALPQFPDKYLELQETITGVMKKLGAEYAAPSSGSNVQTIQLQDLDGDGQKESAVAFFRVANAEKPLKLYVFKQSPSTNAYETKWVIEGEGTGIYSVAFEDLGGTKEKEIVVCWQISTKVQSLTAYSLQNDGDVVELMRSGYTKNTVTDLDRDNDKEIVLVQMDTAEGNSRAELYNYDNGLMVLTSSVPLSLQLTEIKSVKTGSLTNLTPALFISASFGENEGRVTDVIALREGVLTNLTMDDATGMSINTIRYYADFQDANGRDINGDGVLEVPISEMLPPVGSSTTPLYLLHWVQYREDGVPVHVYTTFHSYGDGWYLVLPESWQGVVTAARKDYSSSTLSERAVSFYYLGDRAAEPEEFLTVYRLTGTNRSYRATIDNRFVLFESGDVIYAAKFQDIGWDCGVDNSDLLGRFNRIKIDWSAES